MIQLSHVRGVVQEFHPNRVRILFDDRSAFSSLNRRVHPSSALVATALLLRGNLGSSSSISNHDIWLSVQTWSWGVIRSGLSRLPNVICTRSSRISSCMESVLPHSGQNPRSAYREERNRLGSLVIQVNAWIGKCTKLRQGPPECLRQFSQWQMTQRIGASSDL